MKVSEADSQLLLFTADAKLIEQVPSPVQKTSKGIHSVTVHFLHNIHS